MAILSVMKQLRPIITGPSVASSAVRRTVAATASAGTSLFPSHVNQTFNTARRSVSVLGAKSHKHLLSEFVGVRGPVAEEVRASPASKVCRMMSYVHV